MTIVATDRGIDYSGARPSPAGTFKAGGRFIIRYSAGVGSTQAATAWKVCGKGEIAAAIAAGLDFIANSEWYESRITEGATAGAADGRADLAFWKSRGLARGAAIYVSWDASPARALWGKVDAYLAAYRKALAGYYQLGCYAGTPYLKHALAAKLISYGWRPNAGGWSGDGLPYQPNTTTAAARATLLARALKATPAAIYQTGNYWWSKGADENMLLRPAGTHLQAIAAAKAAAAKPPVKPPVVKPPAPKPAAAYYAAPTSLGKALVHPDRAWSYWPTNDGRIDVRHNGKHVYYMGVQQ